MVETPRSRPMTRRVRTFHGCLTCRKRKIKCDLSSLQQSSSSCKNCNRLRIPCRPSFHSNFKNASFEEPDGNGKRNVLLQHNPASPPEMQIASSFHRSTAAITDIQAVSRTVSARHSSPIHNPPNNFTEQLFMEQHDEFDEPLTQQPDHLIFSSEDQAPGIFSCRATDMIYDPNLQQSAAEFSDFLDPFTHAPCNTASPGASDGFLFEVESLRPQEILEIVPWEDDDFNGLRDKAMSPSPPLETSIIDVGPTSSIPIDLGSDHPSDRNLSISTSPHTDPRTLGMPHQLPQNHGADATLTRYFESTMSTFFSSKSPQLNLYTYMFCSQQGALDSPLRDSILAWTGLHFTRRYNQPPNNSSKYYNSASRAVQDLLKELSTVQSPLCARKSDSNSNKLYTVLSTCFFLSHCDFMKCETSAFSKRLDSLKLVLMENWETLRGGLGSIASRLLIWLAYLDLRASLWKKESSPRRIGDSQDTLPVLLDMLDNLKALPSLRSVSANQSYLGECFGEKYPSTKICEDIVQETINAMSDDIMCVISRIKRFEIWQDGLTRGNSYKHDSALQDLHAAKANALRAEIASIQSEYNLAFLDSVNNETVLDRICFRHLTVSALHYCATILLNRILEPNIRTDEESQSAAREICKITRQLRRAGFLRTPQSLVWPLPIFIAGIETTDSIYQEWILAYMEEIDDWGPNMKTMRLLFCKIIQRQEREDRRVKVRDVMEDFDLRVLL